MNNVNTIINIPPFYNKYHNKIKNNKNLRYIFIDGTIARDDIKKLIPTAFSSGWDFKTSNKYKILKEL